MPRTISWHSLQPSRLNRVRYLVRDLCRHNARGPSTPRHLLAGRSRFPPRFQRQVRVLHVDWVKCLGLSPICLIHVAWTSLGVSVVV